MMNSSIGRGSQGNDENTGDTSHIFLQGQCCHVLKMAALPHLIHAGSSGDVTPSVPALGEGAPFFPATTMEEHGTPEQGGDGHWFPCQPVFDVIFET